MQLYKSIISRSLSSSSWTTCIVGIPLLYVCGKFCNWIATNATSTSDATEIVYNLNSVFH